MENEIIWKEIFEQPEIAKKLLGIEFVEINKIVSQLSGKFNNIMIVARGSSDNAGMYAKYLFGVHNHIPVSLATPSLFTLYNSPPILHETLVIGISQSGQSPDILCVLEECKKQNQPTIAITNDPQSPFAKIADWVINIHAGNEKAIAATKSYTAQLIAVAMLSAVLGKETDREKELYLIPNWIEEVLAQDEIIAQFSKRYRFMEHCVTLGRGFNYATAFEWALKLKELTYIIAEPYSSADFMHGPIAMIDRGFPILAISPNGCVYNDMLSLLKNLKEIQHADLLVVSDKEEAQNIADISIKLPRNIPEWISPIVGIVPAQLFSAHLSKIKGYDPVMPRGLNKVTETI